MKLYSFPIATLEKAINRRLLTLAPEHREWFTHRWQQKPYKKSFIENKAMPLVYCLAKCKNWTDEEFNTEMADWNVTFYPAEVEVLRPMIEDDSLIQLMQKKIPPERIQALQAKLDENPAS